MSDILTAIKAIVENPRTTIANKQANTNNRVTQMGVALEEYVKNAFADCIDQNDRFVNEARSKVFSYMGNTSNPPDAMLKNSDAIEIKKIDSIRVAQLQLNSSYPKNKLRSDNPRLCNACRECEDWYEKDMLYVIGQVDEHFLQNIFFIYGDLYCDSYDIYENVEHVIKEGLENIENIEVAETNELSRINKVDHLGISDLRVRGMWLIKSPFIHFNYLIENNKNYTFKLVALIPISKYYAFKNVFDFEEFCQNNGVNISDENIPDPKNPAKYIESKLITYFI